ncbi:hypothetical protein CFIMG_004082RA [Ceratocystis fimbriata CBS 114723]|uniref:Uncharacterized protein n=1 Tax=Ceratocystis fimbriata CBS 114723 TaxID=1035309 RepID=A0A2C5X275_9PEZI|nr:hypothetical protein CFIMG_004082RA [Ceratocystis fimbriata CBS 114723]
MGVFRSFYQFQDAIVKLHLLSGHKKDGFLPLVNSICEHIHDQRTTPRPKVLSRNKFKAPPLSSAIPRPSFSELSGPASKPKCKPKRAEPTYNNGMTHCTSEN